MTRIAQTATSPRGSSWLAKRYFLLVGMIVLVLTLVGFFDNLVTDIGQASNSDPKFVIHGLFCLFWVVLFCVQAALVSGGNLRLHRALGVAGMVIALGVTLSTLYVFVAVWKGWDAMALPAKANRFLLPSFALFVLLAWLNRKRADRHKRLVCIATLFTLGPVLSRTYDPLIISWMEPLFPALTEKLGDPAFHVYMLVMWSGLLLSLVWFDWTTTRRLHPVTLAGITWFYLIWLIVWLL